MTTRVSDAAQPRREQPLPSHAALGVRLVESLEACASLLGTAVAEDDDVRAVRDIPGRGDLFFAARLLEHAIAAVTEAMRVPSRPVRAARLLRVHELLAELHSLWHEVQQEFLARQVAMLGGVRDALQRLRGAESMPQMIERVTVEVCRSCGVDRCTLFRSNGGTLTPESVHFAQDPAFQEEWWTFARSHPVVVDPRDAEVQLLRRNMPILVVDPFGNGIRDIARAAHSRGYVAAPVIVRGSPAVTLHADRYFSEETVDPVARDVLATFAQGFGYALERTLLLERMRSQLGRIRHVMDEADSDDVFDSDFALRPDGDGRLTAVARGPATDSRLVGLLTRRELEVVQLMARGASNADIGAELVITEGTVKSHVKHILRKMRATNRAQAVACYTRMQALARTA